MVTKTKEPWEMTQEEYLKSTYEASKSSAIDQTPKKHRGDEKWLKESITWRQDMMANAHKTYIRKMLKEGKPVPPEVLKDYPDLKPTTPTEAPKKTGLEQTIIPSDSGDVSVSKLAKNIERAKTDSQKNALFLSVYGEDRVTLLQHIILSMPSGKYLLSREGRVAPSLEREIINKYGVQAGTSDLKKIVRGLSTTSPDRVSANFTLGLDELTLKSPKPTPKPAEKAVSLNWDAIHIQSREELLIGAGMNKKLADKKWNDLDTWEQNLIKDSLKRRSRGKAVLKPTPPAVEKPKAIKPKVAKPVKAKKPTKVAKKIEKRKARRYTKAELREIHAERSPRSVASDNRQAHDTILETDSPRIPAWIRTPGIADIRGVDTPGTKVYGKVAIRSVKEKEKTSKGKTKDKTIGTVRTVSAGGMEFDKRGRGHIKL